MARDVAPAFLESSYTFRMWESVGFHAPFFNGLKDRKLLALKHDDGSLTLPLTASPHQRPSPSSTWEEISREGTILAAIAERQGLGTAEEARIFALVRLNESGLTLPCRMAGETPPAPGTDVEVEIVEQPTGTLADLRAVLVVYEEVEEEVIEEVDDDEAPADDNEPHLE